MGSEVLPSISRHRVSRRRPGLKINWSWSGGRDPHFFFSNSTFLAVSGFVRNTHWSPLGLTCGLGLKYFYTRSKRFNLHFVYPYVLYSVLPSEANGTTSIPACERVTVQNHEVRGVKQSRCGIKYCSEVVSTK